MTKQELEIKKEKLQKELGDVKKELCNFELEEKKAKYGDKFTCEFCKFNAVRGFDIYHNTCGADNCTCCHGVCEKYEPDNQITLFIKKNLNPNKEWLRSDKTNGHGFITEDEYRAIDELLGDIFRHPQIAEKAIKVLSICFNVKENE